MTYKTKIMKKVFEIKVEWTKKGMLLSKNIKGITNIEKLGIVKYLEMELELEIIQDMREKESKDEIKK